ncbi:MAG: acylase [Acidobacteriota bacterium]
MLAAVPAAAEATRAEILWDTYGVPHIFARDAESLFRAFGWAQAHSHGNLIFRLYGQARGRGAEYWGEPYLAADRWVRINGIPERARAWYQAQTPEHRRYLDAFAEGLNAYAREHGARISDEVRPVLPVSAIDVIAHIQRVIHFSFVANPQMAAQLSGPPRGSNTWAVAPARSASRRALLLMNPHLPWSDFFLWYEAQWVAPSVNLYGATLVGFPVLPLAFNDHLGWSHTVNTYDGADLYELTPAGNGYRFDGAVRAFETETQIVKVRQKDGTLREEKLVVRRSLHGPVIGERNGKPIALRVAGLDQPGMAAQYWAMARARNLNEFETALKRMQIPMFTVMYADRDGHIMHLFNGRVPVRPKGDYDWRGVVPGDTSSTLWTKTHPYEDLPRVLDPPSGWLQNANDPPWTTTFPLALNPEKFPPYMAPRSMAFRPQRSARMLREDASITFDELIQYKHSTRMELADRILDELVAAARKHGGAKAAQAAAVLEKWDRGADAESRGAELFLSFARRWLSKTAARPFAVPWNQDSPADTPRGLSDPAKAAAMLEAAAEEVEKKYGRLDVPWGEICRLRRGDLDLPGNGGPGDPLGIFRVVGYAPTKDGHFEAVAGDSWVAAVEFANPVRAMALVTYGNSSQPGSRHLTDQLPLFANKQLRPVWRTRKEIEAHLEDRTVF